MAFKCTLPDITKGLAYKKTFRWYTQNTAGVRTPVDLTGRNGLIQVRTAPGKPVLAEWSTSNGLLSFSDINLISIDLDRSDTKVYSFTDAEWALVIWPGDDKENAELVLYGDVTLNQVVTDVGV